MVGADAQAFFRDIRGQMPVAQMPNHAQQGQGCGAADFQQRFRRGANRQPAAVADPQAVAMGHGDGLGQIQQDVFAAIGPQPDAPAVAIVKGQRDAVLGQVHRPVAGVEMSDGAFH